MHHCTKFHCDLTVLANLNSRSRSLYAVARPSVCCNAREPSAGWNFRQCFYAIWYLGHRLTSMENFTEIVGGLNATGVGKYSDFGPVEDYISETVQDSR